MTIIDFFSLAHCTLLSFLSFLHTFTNYVTQVHRTGMRTTTTKRLMLHNGNGQKRPLFLQVGHHTLMKKVVVCISSIAKQEDPRGLHRTEFRFLTDETLDPLFCYSTNNYKKTSLPLPKKNAKVNAKATATKTSKEQVVSFTQCYHIVYSMYRQLSMVIYFNFVLQLYLTTCNLLLLHYMCVHHMYTCMYIYIHTCMYIFYNYIQ